VLTPAERRPKLTLKITVEANEHPDARAAQGRLDLIVSGIPAIASDDLVQEHLYDDEFVAMRRPITRSCGANRDDRTSRASAVVPPQHPVWQGLQRAFEDKAGAPRFTIEANSAPLRLPPCPAPTCWASAPGTSCSSSRPTSA